MGHPAINALQVETDSSAQEPPSANAWDDAVVNLPNGGPLALLVEFQRGPVDSETGPNGCGIEQVIQVAILRLEMHNAGPMRCRENSLAITHLQEALRWLDHRTAAREVQGVEGTMEPHA